MFEDIAENMTKWTEGLRSNTQIIYDLKNDTKIVQFFLQNSPYSEPSQIRSIGEHSNIYLHERSVQLCLFFF